MRLNLLEFIEPPNSKLTIFHLPVEPSDFYVTEFSYAKLETLH